jgi:hypothetical protein
MTNTPTYDFTKLAALLDSAAISVAEAATIFKVSRPTLYSWREGNAPTQGLLLANAERLIKTIERAVAAKDLPLSPDIEREKRQAALVQALRKHLQA